MLKESIANQVPHIYEALELMLNTTPIARIRYDRVEMTADSVYLNMVVFINECHCIIITARGTTIEISNFRGTMTVDTNHHWTLLLGKQLIDNFVTRIHNVYNRESKEINISHSNIYDDLKAKETTLSTHSYIIYRKEQYFFMIEEEVKYVSFVKLPSWIDSPFLSETIFIPKENREELYFRLRFIAQDILPVDIERIRYAQDFMQKGNHTLFKSFIRKVKENDTTIYRSLLWSRWF